MYWIDRPSASLLPSLIILTHIKPVFSLKHTTFTKQRTRKERLHGDELKWGLSLLICCIELIRAGELTIIPVCAQEQHFFQIVYLTTSKAISIATTLPGNFQHSPHHCFLLHPPSGQWGWTLWSRREWMQSESLEGSKQEWQRASIYREKDKQQFSFWTQK